MLKHQPHHFPPFPLPPPTQQEYFEQVFAQQYASIHRLETNKLRNVAKLFAHLLYADAVPWTVFEVGGGVCGWLPAPAVLPTYLAPPTPIKHYTGDPPE